MRHLFLTAGIALLSATTAIAQFTDVTSGPLEDTGSGRGVAWGDYDSDGDLDLYIANSGSPDIRLRNDGNEVFVDVTTPPDLISLQGACCVHRPSGVSETMGEAAVVRGQSRCWPRTRSGGPPG